MDNWKLLLSLFWVYIFTIIKCEFPTNVTVENSTESISNKPICDGSYWKYVFVITIVFFNCLILTDTIHSDLCCVDLIKGRNVLYQGFCYSQDLSPRLIMIKNERILSMRQ